MTGRVQDIPVAHCAAVSQLHLSFVITERSVITNDCKNYVLCQERSDLFKEWTKLHGQAIHRRGG
jgi:hypothetical protein